MRDLKSSKWMWIKAALFLVIGVAGLALIWLERPTLRLAVLLVLMIWAFCRAYYFAFYVVEHYVDSEYHFSGLLSFLRYLLGRKGP